MCFPGNLHWPLYPVTTPRSSDSSMLSRQTTVEDAKPHTSGKVGAEDKDNLEVFSELACVAVVGREGGWG